MECIQHLSTEVGVPLTKTRGNALTEPQDGWSIHWNILLSRLYSFLPKHERRYLTTQTLLPPLETTASALSCALMCEYLSWNPSHPHHRGNKGMCWSFYFNSWARSPTIATEVIKLAHWSWRNSRTPVVTRGSSHQEKMVRAEYIPNSWCNHSEPGKLSPWYLWPCHHSIFTRPKSFKEIIHNIQISHTAWAAGDYHWWQKLYASYQ